MRVAVLATLATALIGQAAAQLPFKFGSPTFFGSGCPAGTVRLVPSTDGQTFSVLFSAYNAQTSSSSTRQRKSCNLAVPVDVQPGFSVAIFKVDYRGNVYVGGNDGSNARFDTEYFFAGSRGPSSNAKWDKAIDDNVLLTVDAAAIVWSPCGASTNFRVNSAITAFKPSPSASDVQIAIDSADATTGGFRYYVQYQQC
ncbi:TPA: hypothetical protein N0F65_008370 [Lagenidium giganteum]|uniref:DUF4360 domain-containing protein n=1 Tax=Lagenidium giganteum TaxID=4803 RepID=A0AAV2YVW6_9STRA|nr:TPA: hypothetical protein N0F65_008370 [Lagenidium giganteum]